VAYLVGHGGRRADGEVRVVLGGRRASLRTASPAQAPVLRVFRRAHHAHASGALRAAHALDRRQAHRGALEGAAPGGRAQRDPAGSKVVVALPASHVGSEVPT
jgi:hypothetical protein